MPTPLQSEPNEANLTAAVQRCCEAYYRVLAIPRPPDGKGSSECFAKDAYRQAMPFLTSFDNIDAFIACVTHGMVLGAIDYDHGSKLLYAAQVAIGSRRARQQAARANSTNQPKRDTPTPSTSTVGAPGPSHLGTWDVPPTPSPVQTPDPAPPTTSVVKPTSTAPPPSPITQTPNPATKKPVASEVSDPTGLIHHAEECLARCVDSRGLSS